MKLSAVEFRGTYKAETLCTRPFHEGSRIHGLLGRALHGGPLYDRLFAPRVPAGHPFLRPGQGAPPALVPLLAPPGQRPHQVGDTITVAIRVFGALALAERAALTEALMRMEATPWGEGRVRCQGTAMEEIPLITLSRPGVSRATGRVVLRFVTPAWLEQDGRLVSQVSCEGLVRTAFRRFTSLCTLYGELSPEHRDLLAELSVHASEVRVREQRLSPLRWRRESWEHGQTHPMMGVLGSVVLEGIVSSLLPLFRVAERIHLGKQTSFGLGRIAVEEASERHGQGMD